MDAPPPTVGAALLKPKKKLTPEQRAIETKKRAGRRKAAKLRAAEAQAATARVIESQHADALQAPANIVAQAAAQAVVMLKEEALNAALEEAGIVGVSLTAVTSLVSAVNRPSRPGSPALSSASPPCVFPPGLALSRLGSSRDMSPKISSVSNVPVPPASDLNDTLVAGNSPAVHSNAARVISSGKVPYPRNLFVEMPTPTPSDPACFDDDCIMAEMNEGGPIDQQETQQGVDSSKKRANDSPVVDLEDGTPSTSNRAVRPRGHKTSKQDAKREASTLALQETLKCMFAEKEVSSAKRDERKRREKEEHMNNFLEVQKRKLQIDEANARSRAKEVELKSKEVELGLLAEDNRIMMADLSIMDPVIRAWFEKKQKMILERDA